MYAVSCSVEMGITALDGSLLWLPYLKFACSVDLCVSYFALVIYFANIAAAALPTPHRNQAIGDIALRIEIVVSE